MGSYRGTIKIPSLDSLKIGLDPDTVKIWLKQKYKMPAMGTFFVKTFVNGHGAKRNG